MKSDPRCNPPPARVPSRETVLRRAQVALQKRSVPQDQKKTGICIKELFRCIAFAPRAWRAPHAVRLLEPLLESTPAQDSASVQRFLQVTMSHDRHAGQTSTAHATNIAAVDNAPSAKASASAVLASQPSAGAKACIEASIDDYWVHNQEDWESRAHSPPTVTCPAQGDAAVPPGTPDRPCQTFFGRSDKEHVFTQWSSGTCLGIRSLPNALQPGFREQLFTELVAMGQARRRRQHARMHEHLFGAQAQASESAEPATATIPLLAHSTKGAPLQMPVSLSLSSRSLPLTTTRTVMHLQSTVLHPPQT
jgi:hypothetical protein